MASQSKILGVLAGASGAMNRVQIEEKVGESYRKFQVQLDRLEKKGFIENKGDHQYVLTDTGRAEALNPGIEEPTEDTPEESPDGTPQVPQEGVPPSPPAAPKKVTQATTGTTEYQQFLKLGEFVGVVPASLIKVTTDHIWTGGDYKNLKWVAQGLQDMNIQRDLANRWFHAWHSHLQIPLPTGLPSDFLPPDAKKAEEKVEADKKQGVGKRDYILDDNEAPQFVGEGNGNLDYKDAVDLSKLRAIRGKPGANSSTGSMADEMAKIIALVKTLSPEVSKGKSYIVKPGNDGNYQIEEVDLNKPMIIPSQAPAAAAPSYLVSEDGKVEKMEPGKPLVIVKTAASPPPGGQSARTILVDKRTGETSEVASGSPVIIIRDGPNQNQPGGMNPIQVKDKDGNPMVLDISTFIRLEEHKEKQRRDEETHQVKMDIAKTFKDALNKAGKALGNMGEGGGED